MFVIKVWILCSLIPKVSLPAFVLQTTFLQQAGQKLGLVLRGGGEDMNVRPSEDGLREMCM